MVVIVTCSHAVELKDVIDLSIARQLSFLFPKLHRGVGLSTWREVVTVNKYSYLLFLFWGPTTFIQSPIAVADDNIAAATVEGAVDIAGDLALLPSGIVVSLKTGQFFERVRLFTQIQGNSSAGCGVLHNGSVTCWESHFADQPKFFLPENLGEVSSVAGSPEAGCAARKDGKVTCWDHENTPRTQGPIKSSELIFAGLDDLDRPKPIHYTDLPGLHDVVAVTGGRDGCSLDHEGTVACWGRHLSSRSASQLAYDAVPKRVAGITRARQVVQSGYVRCALLAGGEILCWGHRVFSGVTTAAEHQLPFDEHPRRIQGITDATQISISIAAESGCATRRNGQVACWGSASCDKGSTGKAVVVAGMKDVAKVSVAFPSICAQYRKGGIYCRPLPRCPWMGASPR